MELKLKGEDDFEPVKKEKVETDLHLDDAEPFVMKREESSGNFGRESVENDRPSEPTRTSSGLTPEQDRHATNIILKYGIIFLVALFLLGEIPLLYLGFIKGKGCTQPIEATVTGVKISARRVKQPGRNIKKRVVSYKPKYSYEVNGKVYTGKSDVTYKEDITGEKITVLYNPDSPKHSIKEGEADRHKQSAVVLPIIFLVLIGGFTYFVKKA